MGQAIIIILFLTALVPFGIFLKGVRSANRLRKALVVNIISFFAVLIGGTVVMSYGNVFAAEAAAQSSSDIGLALLAAGLPTGLSCIGAGIAIASAASAAIGALSENEGLMGKALIFVALAEGVAIYGLIISIMILGRI